MPTTRAFLLAIAACFALGSGTQAAATAGTQCLTASSTCHAASIADIDQVILELQLLRDAKATKEAGKPCAPLTREEQLAFTFPDEGKVGMMKGGNLGKVGYSKKTRTFPACRDACMDDFDCLAFHWSGKHRHCGLKDTGELYMSVSVDNRYQKTFRSFKRLEVTGCTPATTAAGTTTAEPTATTSATSTTTPAATTSTTSTTTAEPTTLGYCSYTEFYLTLTLTFEQGFVRYFADAKKECAINTFDTSAVTTMHSRFMKMHTFNQNINDWNTSAVVDMSEMFNQAAAFNQNINGWATSAVTDMAYMFKQAAAFNQNINDWNTGAVATMYAMFMGAAAFNQNINGWDTGAVASMGYIFFNAAALNQSFNGWDTGAVTSYYASRQMFVNTSMDETQQPEFNAACEMCGASYDDYLSQFN